MNKKNTLTKKDRIWRAVGIIGNIVILVFTILAAVIIAKAGINAVFFPATAEYQFMNREGSTIIAVTIDLIGIAIFLWVILVAFDTAEKLLKCAARWVVRKVAKIDGSRLLSILGR